VNIDFYSPYQNNIMTLIQGTEISLVLWSWWMVLNAGQVEIFQKNKIGVCILPDTVCRISRDFENFMSC